MKNRIIFMSLAIVFALMISSIAVYGQNSNASGKLKSRIVHEEKTEKGVKKVLVDSEEKYDLYGNVIDEVNYKGGKVDTHMIYEYDVNNNKIKETEIDASGKPKKIGEYKYVNGLRTEKYTYDENKKLISKKTYTYIYN